MKINIKQIVIHILCWLVFLLIPIVFSPDFRFSEFVFISIFQRDLIGFLLLVASFYLNYYFFIPKFYFQKKYFIYSLLILSCFVIICCAPELHGQNFHTHLNDGSHHAPPLDDDDDDTNIFFNKIEEHFFQFLVVVGFALMLRVTYRMKQIEKEKLNAELSFFKAQIQPHFLFNTLNSIYSLSIQKSENLPKAIILFSDILRYVTTEAHNNFVALEKELGYLNNYIELQKIRFENTVNVTFFTNGVMEGKEISPLILITFVENSFKYGINPEKKSEIKISVFVTNEELCMTVFNYKVTKPKSSTESGLGMKNTKKRLQFLYPSKHTLEINDDEKSFSVLLKINLK